MRQVQEARKNIGSAAARSGKNSRSGCLYCGARRLGCSRFPAPSHPEITINHKGMRPYDASLLHLLFRTVISFYDTNEYRYLDG